MTEKLAGVGDSASQLRALLSGCGVYVRSDAAKLVLTGEDRVRWANGMVTNNIRDLAHNHGNYSFLLNPQGRIQADLTIYNRGDHFLVETDAEQVQRVKDIFDRYIIMDDVEVTDISDRLLSIGVEGPKSGEILCSAKLLDGTLDAGAVVDSDFGGIGYSVGRSVSQSYESYELWMAPQNADAVWNAIVLAGAVPVGAQALEWLRIVRGVPKYGIDISDRELPQETAQMNSLHYSKGCYIGQEIVERIHSRGNVHRTFSGLEIEGESPARGSKISVGEKEIGEITSVDRIPLAGGARTLALGYLRREASMPDSQVTVNGTPAKVRSLPFQVT